MQDSIYATKPQKGKDRGVKCCGQQDKPPVRMCACHVGVSGSKSHLCFQSSLLLMRLGGSRGWLQHWAARKHLRNLDTGSGSWLWTCSVPAAASIWKVNKQTSFSLPHSLSVIPSFKQINKIFKS